MSRVEELERQIKALSPAELTSFRQWFADFDAASWDQQFASDVAAGRLDALAARALDAHRKGKTTEL